MYIWPVPSERATMVHDDAALLDCQSPRGQLLRPLSGWLWTYWHFHTLSYLSYLVILYQVVCEHVLHFHTAWSLISCLVETWRPCWWWWWLMNISLVEFLRPFSCLFSIFNCEWTWAKVRQAADYHVKTQPCQKWTTQNRLDKKCSKRCPKYSPYN